MLYDRDSTSFFMQKGRSRIKESEGEQEERTDEEKEMGRVWSSRSGRAVCGSNRKIYDGGTEILHKALICHGYVYEFYGLREKCGKSGRCCHRGGAEAGRAAVYRESGQRGEPDQPVRGGSLSEDTSAILGRALEIHKETDGLFDPTIYPLMRLWGFPTHAYHVPTEEELERVLPLTDASSVQYDKETVVLGKRQEIDLGGIAKGYTSARVMEIFRSYGVRSGLVSLGETCR